MPVHCGHRCNQVIGILNWDGKVSRVLFDCFNINKRLNENGKSIRNLNKDSLKFGKKKKIGSKEKYVWLYYRIRIS